MHARKNKSHTLNLRKGDLSQFSFGDPQLPDVYYEVESFQGKSKSILNGKFSSLADAQAHLNDIKTTTLKHIIKWVRPGTGGNHQMRLVF